MTTIRKSKEEHTKARVLIITGNGKGKTSSAFGMALRALGHNNQIALIQFIKHDGHYGEVEALKQFANASVHCTGLGFTPKDSDSPQWIKHKKAALLGWDLAKTYLLDPSIKLVVLDEFFYLFHYDFLSVDEAINELRNIPDDKIIIMTGRNAPKELYDYADTISEVVCIKHASQQGIPAQKGFEY